MKVIRKGVFETNSSSTHVISITGGECENPDRLFPSEDGVYRIHPGEFGFEVRTYHDAVMKASYALTWAKQTNNEHALRMLRAVIEREVGGTVEFVPNDGGDYDKWGHIDHQSAEKGNQVCEPAFVSLDTLESFTFNPSSFLHTDNDNH